LATVVAGPVATWLYREIETDAATVAEVAGAYVEECERWDRTPCGGADRVVAGTVRRGSARLSRAVMPHERHGAVHGVASFASQHPVALWRGRGGRRVLVSVRRSHRRTARALARVRPAASTVVLSTVVTALVIVGVEWLVATSNPRPGTLLAVLAVPALLAGVTVGRLVAAAQLGSRIEDGGYADECRPDPTRPGYTVAGHAPRR